MTAVAKAGQVVLAAIGFLVGYGWAVQRWLQGAGMPASGETARVLLSTGLSLTCVYAVLLGVLFHSCLPSGREGGLRMVVTPTAFTLSAVLGALGMEGALRLVS